MPDETAEKTGRRTRRDAPKGDAPKAAPKPKRATAPSGRADALSKAEDRLNEMFGGIAMFQGTAAGLSGNPAHIQGAAITAQFGPGVSQAWIQLARENDGVKRIILRLTEGTAWGEAIFITLGYAYCTAQAYGALPENAPNIWGPVQPSDEVMAHAAAANGESPIIPAAPAPEPDDVPITGVVKGPPRSGVDADDAARAEAEAERLAMEQRRREQNTG